MISYPFIETLFRSVLTLSKGIGGRFFISTRSGTEINSDDLGQVITDTLGKGTVKKYPLVMMMPPVSDEDTMYQRQRSNDDEMYQISMFFLKTVYYLSDGSTAYPNPTTGTSTHTIPQDWHDMKRCAKDFVKSLDLILRNHDVVNLARKRKVYQPVAGTVGTDRLSGIRLDFFITIADDCAELEDYDPVALKALTLPEGDSHPAHRM